MTFRASPNKQCTMKSEENCRARGTILLTCPGEVNPTLGGWWRHRLRISKKLENLNAALSLYFAWYNFYNSLLVTYNSCYRGRHYARQYGIFLVYVDRHAGVDIMSSGSQHRRPSPLSENALRQLIRVAVDKGYYTESLHHPERNISVDDVLHGADRSDWTLIGEPEWDGSRKGYKFKILTVDIEGDELTLIVAAFPEEKRIEFVTAW